MSEQLPLFRPRSDASFANFFVANANAATLHALHAWLARREGVFFLHGAQGSGRSHVLQAVCKDRAALYLPLAELSAQNPQQVLDALEAAALVCLDDIHAVTRDRHWCEQLFHLFNRCAQTRTQLLISADRPSAQLACALADLQSRLGWGGNFRLAALDDSDRAQALQLRARERGIDLSNDVVAYILARHARDFSALLALLERLDRQSLAKQKRITVPFVRRLIDTDAV